MTGYTGILDSLLKNGITNSVVCLERLQAVGFPGGISSEFRDKFTTARRAEKTASMLTNIVSTILPHYLRDRAL